MKRILIILLIFGCGGGGGPEPQNTIEPESNEIRLLSIGDKWVYEGEIKDNLGTIPATVERTISGEIRNNNAQTCLIEEIVISDGLNVVRQQSLLYQDVFGSLFTCGIIVNGKALFVQGGVRRFVDSPLEVGNITSGVVTLTDGSWADCTILVESFENVTTPAGTFGAFKVSQSCSNSRGQVTKSTLWYSPSHYIIKSDGVVSAGVSATSTLEAYSLK